MEWPNAKRIMEGWTGTGIAGDQGSHCACAAVSDALRVLESTVVLVARMISKLQLPMDGILRRMRWGAIGAVGASLFQSAR